MFAASIAFVLPLGWWLWCYVLLLMLFTHNWWQQWCRWHQVETLLIGEQGELRWLQSDSVAGQLQVTSLVTEWVICLRWRTAPDRSCPGGKQQERWLFADQCSDDDFRALARSIRQRRWLLANRG